MDDNIGSGDSVVGRAADDLKEVALGNIAVCLVLRQRCGQSCPQDELVALSVQANVVAVAVIAVCLDAVPDREIVDDAVV